MNKNKITIFLALLLVFLFFIFNSQIFFQFQKLQFIINKKLVFNLKNSSFLYWGILIFFYGLIHSIGPGHGKLYLLTLSMRHKKRVLILYSAIIAYFQAILSFTIVYVLIKYIGTFNMLHIKYLDDIGKNIYGITLMILGLLNIIGEFFETKTKFFVFGVFFPCSGLLSLLLAITMLGYQKYLLISSFIMATGMFVTLSIFSIFIDKFKFTTEESKKSKLISFGFYLLVFLIGLYIFI